MSINFAIIPTVWVVALIAGIIQGVGIKSGIDPSETGISLFVLEAFCKASENVSDSTTPQTCWILFGFASVLSAVIFLASVLASVQSVGHWIAGVIVYALGFVPGIMIILSRSV